jgi:hypothetical protein
MTSKKTQPFGHARRRRPVVLVALALVSLVCIGRTIVPTPTDAAWTATNVARATLSAATVLPPSVSGCSGTALSTTVRIDWSLPTSGGYTAADIAFGVNSSGLGTLTELLGGTTSATTEQDNGVYTTTLSSGLLSGIVQSLLGETIYISLWTMYKPSSGISSTWVSKPVGYAVTYPLVLGLVGGTCSAAMTGS